MGVFQSRGDPSATRDPGSRCRRAARRKAASLDLIQCGLEALPVDLGRCAASLTALDVSNNGLATLPSSLRALQALRSLAARGNGMQRVAEGALDLPALETLDLRSNRLAALPLVLERLPRLRELRVSSNVLEELPAAPQLQLLDVGYNELRELPAAGPRLRALMAESNFVARLPDLHAGALESFNVSGNLVDLRDPGLPASLTELDLSSCELAELPGLEALPRLRVLLAPRNELAALPDAVGRLRELRELNVAHNQLEALPDALRDCGRLDVLVLSHNRLAALPSALAPLPLSKLQVVGNRLTELPEWLGAMRSLRTLHVQQNELRELPAALGALTGLERLSALGNPLERVAPEVEALEAAHPVNLPVGQEVLPHLFLGGLALAENRAFLEARGVQHVINLAGGSTPARVQETCYFRDAFEYYTVDVLDSVDADLMPHFAPTFQYIDEALAQGQGVVVHCAQGVSRSAAIVVAYVMRSQGCNLDAAVEMVREARSCICINSGFMRQLEEYGAFLASGAAAAAAVRDDSDTEESSSAGSGSDC